MYTMAECETILLGHLLANPSIIDTMDIPDYVFFTPENTAIFEAIQKSKDGGLNPDLIMVSDELIKAGHRDKLGILASIEKPQSFETCTYYLDKLLEYARKREIKTAVRVMNDAIEDPSITAVELADKALETISEAMQKTTTRQAPTIGALMAGYIDDLSQRCTDFVNGTTKSFGVGFPELDNMIGPLRPGEIIIVAARPGAGKTAFALQVADYVTMRRKKPSAYFSMEMTSFDMIDRVLAKNGIATVREMREGSLNSIQLSEVMETCDVYRTSEIAIYDTSQTPAVLHSRIRREVVSRGTKLIVVDYLGLIDGLGADGARARWEKVGEESRALKRLALELKIVIMVCVQLGRDADGVEPSIAMLRDSGSIEQDADRILLFYSAEKDQNPLDKVRPITIKVGKNRHGATGSVILDFDGPHTRFISKDSALPPKATTWENMGNG